MLLPVLFNYRLATRAQDNPKYEILTDKQDIDIYDALELLGKKKDKENGKIYLVADEDYEREFYFLWLEKYDVNAPALFMKRDEERQERYNLTKEEYDAISKLPPFGNGDDVTLGVLLYGMPHEGGLRVNGILEQIRGGGDKLDSIKEFLDADLFLGAIDAMGTNKAQEAKLLDTITELSSEIAEDNDLTIYVVRENDKTALLYQKITAENENRYFVAGDFDIALAAFSKILATHPKLSYHIYGYSTVEDAQEVKRLMDAVHEPKKDAPITKAEESIMHSATEEAKQEKADKEMEDFIKQEEKALEEAVKADKKEKMHHRKEGIKPRSKVTEAEVQEAKVDAAYDDAPQIVEVAKKAPVTADIIAKAQKDASELKDSPKSKSIPSDALDYYTVRQTSEMYNKEMSREEMEAYFYAHSDLERLRKEVIGDYLHSEGELIKEGLLLYNPVTEKLEYRYEYLVGNGYDFLEQLEDAKDDIIKKYGEEFYNNQVIVIEEALPEKMSISSPDVDKIPYIHPLNEKIIAITTKATRDVIFPVPKKFVTEEEGKVSTALLELSLMIFYRAWLFGWKGADGQKHKGQDHRLNGYGLTYPKEIQWLYFQKLSHANYRDKFLEEAKGGNIKKEHITESFYLDRKFGAKRMVEELFQEFLREQLSDETKHEVDNVFNKNFNGYIRAQVKKLPLFCRHNRYIGNYQSKLILKKVQVNGAKFATINNSSIMAHEVGYGKSLTSLAYMSHCFETNRANNILCLVPTPLYDSKKWRDEAVGLLDDKGVPQVDPRTGDYQLGGVPMYNLIEIGNLTEKTVFGDGYNGLKTYTEDEIKKVKKYTQLGAELATQANLPTSFVNPPKAWKKIADLLKSMDTKMYDRFKKPEMEQMLDDFLTFSKVPAAKRKDLQMLVKFGDKLMKPEFEVEFKLLYPNTKFNINFSDHRAFLDDFRTKQTADARDVVMYKHYKRVVDKAPKSKIDNIIKRLANPPKRALERGVQPYEVKYKANGEFTKTSTKKIGKLLTQRKPTELQVIEHFILEKADDVYVYVDTVRSLMEGYGKYEYGKFKFKRGEKNIILGTFSAIDRIGFSSDEIENIGDTINEITEYEQEGSVIGNVPVISGGEEVLSESATGVVAEEQREAGKLVIERSAARVLATQRKYFLDKIREDLTEQGGRPKFELAQLKIDGFVLDEAHMSKKLMTQVKTDNSVSMYNQNGTKVSIRFTSHDISGGTPPAKARRVFGICAYIHSLKGNKPVMLLTATPFSNYPTEIFSMLSLVGMKELKKHGLGNIKNFFDMFIKETLKYDFNHKGEFVKKIVMEEFRNPEKLSEIIWSLMDIQRGQTEADEEMRKLKPDKFIIPKFDSAAIEEEEGGKGEGTTIMLKRKTPRTSSIVDRNEHQIKMMDDIERWLNDEISEKELCKEKFEMFVELAKEEAAERDSYEEDEGTEVGDVEIERGLMEKTVASIRNDSVFGKTFKALGMSRALSLSPYFFRCNDLPYPTPEAFVENSPKIEYLVKCLKSIKDYDESKGNPPSGSVVYSNIMKFTYIYRDEKTGRVKREQFNIAELIKQYLVNKGWFTQNEVDIIASGYSSFYIDENGKKKKKNREQQVKDFQGGKTLVLLGSPAIKEGVDLQRNGATMFILTPDWNPTDMRQVEGRIWRQGNKFSKVRIIYILLDSSIEVFIYSKLEEKKARLEKVMIQRGAIAEHIEEMSLNPEATKVALTSNPKKKADVIVKLEQQKLQEEWNGISRDLSLVEAVDEGLELLEDNVLDLEPTFLRYQTIREEVMKRYVDYKINEIKEDKIKNPDKLIRQIFLDPIKVMTKEGAMEYVYKKNYWKTEKQGYNNKLVDNYKDWAEKYILDKGQRLLATDSKGLQEEIAGMLIEKQKRDYKQQILDAYDQLISHYEDKQTSAMTKLEWDALPLDKKANEILFMQGEVVRLRGEFRQFSPDLQKEIREGTYSIPTELEIIAKMEGAFSEKRFDVAVNPIREVISRYNKLYESHLRARGYDIKSVNTFRGELDANLNTVKEKVSALDIKREDIAKRQAEILAKRVNYNVDDIVRGFEKTNDFLAMREK